MSTAQAPSAADLAETGAGQAAQAWMEQLRDGTSVNIRALHQTDVELERRFIEALSPASRRFRFLETMRSPSAALLKQLTTIDPLTDVAYLASVGAGLTEKEVGVARLSAAADGQDCEFAVTVADEWQGKGLGSALMKHLIDAARSRGLREMHSTDPADNDLMREFAAHLHFKHVREPDDARSVRYSYNL